MKHDILSDAFSIIKNAEAIGKRECEVPASSLVNGVVKILQEKKYVGKVDKIEDGKSGKMRIQLLGRINDCNAIRPRFSVEIKEMIKWEKRYLPAFNVGLLIISTPGGIIDHKKAKEKKTGGVLLGYVY